MIIQQIGRKLREHIHKFSGEVSGGLCKARRRFVEEMIYGIQARGSVRLTEVARALDEPISLKKTHGRLCRNLSDPAIVRSMLGRWSIWEKFETGARTGLAGVIIYVK